MNKKIIGILSAVTLLGGAAYLSGQGGFGALSSSVLSGDACTQAQLDAQKAQYEASSDQIASLEEQMSSLEESISAAEESIATYQTRVAEKKQEIKNTNQEINQLENYIKNQCGVKKTTRGKTTTYSAPDCNPKKNQVANKKQQINNLEKSVKDTNNTIQTAQRNIQNQTSSLQQLENNIAEIEELVEEYDACEITLASGSGGDVEVGADDGVRGEEDNITTGPETGGDLPPANPETEGSENTTTAPAIIIPLLVWTSGETACNRDILVQRESEFFDIYYKLREYSRWAYGSKQGVWYTVAGTVESLQNQITNTEKKIKNLEKSVNKLKNEHAMMVKIARKDNGWCHSSNYRTQKCPTAWEIAKVFQSLNEKKNDFDFQKNKYLPALKDALQIAIQKGVEINLYQSTFLGYQKSYQDCLVSLNIPVEWSRVCWAWVYANNCLMANWDFSSGFNRKS